MDMQTAAPTRFQALMAVRDSFETQQAMADAFGVSQPTVWRWLHQSKQLPVEHVLVAERLTGVSRHHLRPDIYPLENARGSGAWTLLADRSALVTYGNPGVSQSDTPRAFGYGGAR